MSQLSGQEATETSATLRGGERLSSNLTRKFSPHPAQVAFSCLTVPGLIYYCFPTIVWVPLGVWRFACNGLAALPFTVSPAEPVLGLRRVSWLVLPAGGPQREAFKPHAGLADRSVLGFILSVAFLQTLFANLVAFLSSSLHFSKYLQIKIFFLTS